MHPLFVFNQFGDLERCALTGNVSLVLDDAEFHFGGSEKMRSVFLRSPAPWQALVLAPQAGILGGQIQASRRDRRLRVGAPRRSRLAPAASVAPSPQEARTGLRMMPTFPQSPLTFRTAGFP